ncbi:hypothetical protein Tco_0540896 [Tanacetum coccineum]
MMQARLSREKQSLTPRTRPSRDGRVLMEKDQRIGADTFLFSKKGEKEVLKFIKETYSSPLYDSTPGLPVPPSVIKDLSTRLGNLEYRHGQLVKKVMASQMVQAEDRLEQVGAQIQQLQTTVSEMSSRESTLMSCILGMDRHLADLERRPPGPQ